MVEDADVDIGDFVARGYFGGRVIWDGVKDGFISDLGKSEECFMKMFHCIDELQSMLFTFPFWCCPQSIWRKRVGIIGDVLGGLCD